MSWITSAYEIREEIFQPMLQARGQACVSKGENSPGGSRGAKSQSLFHTSCYDNQMGSACAI